MADVIQELRTAAEDEAIVRYTCVATLAVLIYEYIITFDDETRLIWPSRFTFAKVVYFLNRYVPFIATFLGAYVFLFSTRDDLCRLLCIIFGEFLTSLYIIAEGVLFMRTYAIWGRTRVMLVLLLTVFLTGAAAAYYISIKFVTSVIVTTEFKFSPTGCLLTFPNRIEWISQVILFVCETMILCLLLAKAVITFRHSNSPIMYTMYKDGVLYYLFVIGSTVANFIILRTASAQLCNFLLILQAVLQSLLCNRLLLSLRGTYETISTQRTRPTSISVDRRVTVIRMHTVSGAKAV